MKKNLIPLIFIIIISLVSIYYYSWMMSKSMANMGESIEIGNRIVHALEKFKESYGHYPDNLEDIVPQFLSSIPATANSIHKEFHYVKFNRDSAHNDTYKLYFNTGIMDYDQWLYLSDQHYPKKKDGTEYEKLLKWINVSHYDLEDGWVKDDRHN